MDRGGRPIGLVGIPDFRGPWAPQQEVGQKFVATMWSGRTAPMLAGSSTTIARRSRDELNIDAWLSTYPYVQVRA
jgi:hypothetical protein